VLPPRRRRLATARRVGITDLELRLATRDAEAVLGHRDRRSLADDVAAQVDPRRACELEPKTGRFRQRAVHPRGHVQRLENDQASTDPAGVRGQPAKRSLPGRRKPAGQIDHQQVDRPSGKKRPRERKAFRVVCGPDDDEPAQVHPTTNRFERIKRTREVEVGDDRSGRLCLGDPAQCKRRLAAREIAANRGARLSRQTARAEGRVQRGEPGRDDVAAKRRERMIRRLSLGLEARRERSFGRDPGAGSQTDCSASPARFEVGKRGAE
jgi:hypothetical protein